MRHVEAADYQVGLANDLDSGRRSPAVVSLVRLGYHPIGMYSAFQVIDYDDS